MFTYYPHIVFMHYAIYLLYSRHLYFMFLKGIVKQNEPSESDELKKTDTISMEVKQKVISLA